MHVNFRVGFASTERMAYGMARVQKFLGLGWAFILVLQTRAQNSTISTFEQWFLQFLHFPRYFEYPP